MAPPEEDFLRLPSLTVGKQRSEIPHNDKSEPASPYVRIKDNLEHLLIDEDEKMHFSDKTSKEDLKSEDISTSSMEYPTLEPTLQSDPKKTTKTSGVSARLNYEHEKRSLWVGNLDTEVGEAEIWDHFSKFGAIESVKMLGSKECAFVNYFRKEDALAAKDSLQLTPFGRTIIKIRYARDGDMNFSDVNNGSASSLSDPFATDVSTRSVWVGHLGPEVDVSMLQEAFSFFGQIENCRMLEVKNCAFVNFFVADDAARARRELNGAKIGNSIIKTGYAKSGGKMEEKSFAFRKLSEYGHRIIPGSERGQESEEPFITKVGVDEFNQPLPIIPINESTLPEEFNGNVIKECRRRIEHVSCTTVDVDQFATQVMQFLIAASIDPIGNILVQKLVEKGSATTRVAIIHRLGKYLATIGIHKNGTWVVQRIINSVDSAEQSSAIEKYLRPHVTPLLQDQFGNYVVQCCLGFGAEGNRFIFEALYHRCVEIGTSRFGSRAMRSCLESPISTLRQRKFVATAIISVATTLAIDPNGVIVLQWFLDSDLPGKHEFLGQVLKGHYAELALCKQASVIVAKMIHPTVESPVREAAINEIFSSDLLPKLLQEALPSAIVLRCLLTVRPDMKQKLARKVSPWLDGGLNQQSSDSIGNNGSHLDRIRGEVAATLGPETLLNTEAETKASELFSPTLITQAVGGPVRSKSNAPSSSYPSLHLDSL